MHETIKELIPIFEKVAAKIGESGEFVWKTVLKQQYVKALESVVWGIIAFIVGWKCSSMIFAYAATLETPDDGAQGFLYVVSYVLLISGAWWGIYGILNAIKRFYNPAYYTLEFFVDLVSGNDDE